VTTSIDDEGLDGAGAKSCAGCGAAFAGDQRYCLECGARRGPLPVAISARLAELLRRDRGEQEPEDGTGETAPKPVAGAGFMPSPRAAAVAVMGMLAFGVFLGSATSQIAQSAGLQSILLEVASSPPPEEEPVETTAAAPAAGAEAAPLLPATTSSVPLAPAPVEEPVPEAPAEPTAPPEIPEEETLPPVKHVFLIVLGENGYEETFGPSSPAPYLAKTLPEKGELLTNYYAVAKGDLANQIALLSGQGPTAETTVDCPNYTDIVPGTITPEGQVEGSGCVYPAATPTLPGQLVEKKMKWRAYVEDIGNGVATGASATCRHPTLGGSDGSQAPVPGDAYVTWRNPFVYFHSLADGPECAEDDVGLDRLAPDLETAAKTPALSYIVPNACHDGGELPCEPGQPAGPLAAEAFLRTVVPQIEASAAYKEGSLIAITSSQAPQSGPKVDTSACCVSPAFPNVPPPVTTEPATGAVKPTGGGGKVGLLLISPFIAPGTSNETGYYNHFSLLLSIEELFGLEPVGYASELALAPFDSSVYNAAAQPAGSSSSASCRDWASRVPSALQSSPSSSKKPCRARFDLKATR
jgi:phosphatidylinositol-3-phosphatase